MHNINKNIFKLRVKADKIKEIQEEDFKGIFFII